MGRSEDVVAAEKVVVVAEGVFVIAGDEAGGGGPRIGVGNEVCGDIGF